ncbi:MAG: hypothetical protein KatS3mg099_096 [Candidatus Parcubacteria bacterium]|nr:MAG: hypothetical protein KatS3mg099_096 [Candidatus Parcubacteria bacterium]
MPSFAERLRAVALWRSSCHLAVLAIFVCALLTVAWAQGASAQVTAQDVAERRAALEAQLKELEAQIQQQALLVAQKQKERISIERDIAILEAEIKKAQLAIRQRDLYIKELDAEIGDKLQTMAALSDKLAREKASLAQLVRQAYALQEVSLVEMVLSNQSFSDFFSDFDTFYQIKKALQQSFEEIRATQAQTEDARLALEAKRSQQVELRNLQKLQEQQIREQEREKQRLLALAAQEEQARREELENKQKTAAQIRAELFALRDSTAIPFGEAVELAQRAERVTGVRAALILGTLKQETKLGEFIGTGNWRADMHPTRDRPLFQVIARTLGYNPDAMPVSAQPGYGWGGAMGPAQFIPSTWACYGGYINVTTGDCNNRARSLSWDAFWAGPWRYDPGADRIRALLGENRPSDPWRNADAFMAAALLLKENGADERTYAAERLAALRYFAGWSNAKNPAYAFYGDSVMRFAAEFQQMIDILARE